MVDRILVAVGDLDRFTERKIKELTFHIVANLVETNPVDTGWSRNNWVPNIGGPPNGTVGTYEEAKKGGTSPAAQQAALSGIAAGYSLRNGSIYVSNNAKYIGKLNDGYSGQAPAGFVQAAILRAVNQL